MVGENSVEIVQDIDKAILVLYDAGKWLKETGKNTSKWWDPQNMNKDFLLKHSEPNEFYALLIDGKPAGAMILQENERNQSWKSIDKDRSVEALHVHWLCVARQFSGRDLPKKLVEFAVEHARRRGFKRLRLDTDANKEKLMKMYERLGFTLMGVDQDEEEKTAFYEKRV